MEQQAKEKLIVENCHGAFKQRFGPDAELKPKQLEVLEYLASGENVFASLPTGYGKSLCYWLPAAAWKKKVWVISPLIALIEDQAMKCAEFGLRGIGLHSGLQKNEKAKREADLLEGHWDILFLSPERFLYWIQSGFCQTLLANGQGADLITVDEMHLMDDWREFRTSYAEIVAPLKAMLSEGVQFLGLSATFALSRRQYWLDLLAPKCMQVDTPLGRENLSLQILPLEDGRLRWLYLQMALQDIPYGKSVIIYCSTKKECDELSRWLGSSGLLSATYHSETPSLFREHRLNGFREGKLRIICATSAFGMGVDYGGVERVIHFSLPYDLISYWQEAGRAGRDGDSAFAIAFFRRSEISRLRNLSGMARDGYIKLWQAWVKNDCRKKQIGIELGFPESESCGCCSHCWKKNKAAPKWLQRLLQCQDPPWWLEKSAAPELWLKEKISQL